jgi:glutamate racemase
MKPIGIFDSGIGGLTVARAVAKSFPEHSIVYFGDTAHLPYGEKSATLIQRYSARITNELLELGCGAIVVACNSASSNALHQVKDLAGSKVPVIDVVRPAVEKVSSILKPGSQVGVIGTRATISSNWYQQLLHERGFNAHAKATPLLASAIEEGFHNGQVSSALIEAYLGQGEFEECNALILGCTHYPLIAEQIRAFLPDHVMLIDSAMAVAESLMHELGSESLNGDEEMKPPNLQFLVSDLTQSFALGAERFFGAPIQLLERKLQD